MAEQEPRRMGKSKKCAGKVIGYKQEQKSSPQRPNDLQKESLNLKQDQFRRYAEDFAAAFGEPGKLFPPFDKIAKELNI